MPINLSVNQELCLRIVSFEGTVSAADLEQLVTLYDQRRGLLDYDSVYLLDAQKVDVEPDQLDQLRRRVFGIYDDVELVVRRRSAWIFRSPHVGQMAEYWLTERHGRDGSGAEFCVGRTLDDALPLFSDKEIAAVKTGAGFVHLASTEAA